jgi:hypothetical protein
MFRHRKDIVASFCVLCGRKSSPPDCHKVRCASERWELNGENAATILRKHPVDSSLLFLPTLRIKPGLS